MSVWILVVVISQSVGFGERLGVEVRHIEFKSEIGCNAAKSFINASTMYGLAAECFENSPPR